MKLQAPENVNYAATVVRVRHINQLANCDNVVGVPLLGYQAIVSKDVQVGDLGMVFTAETQLSLGYASANNLHRHENLNEDPSKKGYLEDNRRVKALRFRGHRSDALFMPLSSLSGFYSEWDQLQEGDTFDQLDGVEICRKYVARPPKERGPSNQPKKREPRVDEKLFPKHFDTANYFRVADAIAGDRHVVITQKLHGTSIRIGHTLVKRKLTWRDKVAKLLGVKVPETEWAYVYGSRNVVKDPDNPSGHDFYGADLYSQIGSQLKGLLPKGFIVYGEVIGWVPDTDKPIQKGYTYRIPVGGYQLYIYRVTTINEDGLAVDLSWPAVKEFCQSVGLNTVPEVTSAYAVREDLVTYYLDKRLSDTFPWLVPTDGSMVDEGVCLRVEGITPLVVKAKSPLFLQHETKMLDQGVTDTEAEEALV
ncbi:RNA ligase family protein [Micromonospora krabiensis]|uniref:RNA ligase family protein n=1 Tax=Micromonospora krabiensis TaxID=307121 RepID=UPI000B889A3F